MDRSRWTLGFIRICKPELANGEQLDGNAWVKFMEQYKAAHPEQTTGEKTVTDETVKKEPQNGGKADTVTGLENNGNIQLTRHDFEKRRRL